MISRTSGPGMTKQPGRTSIEVFIVALFLGLVAGLSVVTFYKVSGSDAAIDLGLNGHIFNVQPTSNGLAKITLDKPPSSAKPTSYNSIGSVLESNRTGQYVSVTTRTN